MENLKDVPSNLNDNDVLQLYILENTKLNKKLEDVKSLIMKVDFNALMHLCYEKFMQKLREIIFGD